MLFRSRPGPVLEPLWGRSGSIRRRIWIRTRQERAWTSARIWSESSRVPVGVYVAISPKRACDTRSCLIQTCADEASRERGSAKATVMPFRKSLPRKRLQYCAIPSSSITVQRFFTPVSFRYMALGSRGPGLEIKIRARPGEMEQVGRSRVLM